MKSMILGDDGISWKENSSKPALKYISRCLRNSQKLFFLIEKSKSEFFQEKFLVADSKEIFQLVNSMLNSFPDAAESQTMVDKFANFFDTKVKNINQSIDNIICTYSCASQEMDTKPT